MSNLRIVSFLLFINVLLRQTSEANLAKDAKILEMVGTLAQETKELGLKAIKEKTEELLIHLRRVKTSTNSKTLNCQQTLNKLLDATSNDLETCVDKHSEELIALIHDKDFDSNDKDNPKSVKEEIGYCTKDTDDCSGSADEYVEDEISGEDLDGESKVKVDPEAVERQIQLIKDCATKAIQKSNGFARRCVL